MNIRENKGITLVALVITIILLLIISGISITGVIRGNKEAKESKLFSELNMVQHAILERYTKAQLTKEELPGIEINNIEEVKTIINEMDSEITLKGKENEYKKLNKEELEKLGITNSTDTYIVNYSTGEVINATIKNTDSGKALYIYSKESK